MPYLSLIRSEKDNYGHPGQEPAVAISIPAFPVQKFHKNAPELAAQLGAAVSAMADQNPLLVVVGC